jgi:hypothetical protein
MIRNIMLMSAKAVKTMTMKRRRMRRGSSGLGTPAISDPTIAMVNPASTALSVPETLKPAISSSLLMGVTR